MFHGWSATFGIIVGQERPDHRDQDLPAWSLKSLCCHEKTSPSSALAQPFYCNSHESCHMSV
jgi:hypothetical protein